MSTFFIFFFKMIRTVFIFAHTSWMTWSTDEHLFITNQTEKFIPFLKFFNFLFFWYIKLSSNFFFFLFFFLFVSIRRIHVLTMNCSHVDQAFSRKKRNFFFLNFNQSTYSVWLYICYPIYTHLNHEDAGGGDDDDDSERNVWLLSIYWFDFSFRGHICLEF